jgi:cytochrome c biogenesis protein CcmG, thiol:disulfide interchange protein DsbE
MNRNKIIMVLFVLLFSLNVQGDTVVDFKLPDLKNKQVRFSEFLNKGPILLDFWATWCKPCAKAFPKLNGLYKKYHQQGLEIVGINEDGPRSQAKVKPFVRSFKIKFPILIDGNNEVMRRLQVQSLPTTILIAPDGTIIQRYVGYHADEMKDLEKQILKLLKQSNKEIIEEKK